MLFFTLILFETAHSQVNIDSSQVIWTDDSAPDSSRFKAIMNFYVGCTQSLTSSTLEGNKYHYRLAKQKNLGVEIVKSINERSLAFYVLEQVDSAMGSLKSALKVKRSFNDTTDRTFICES